MIYLENTANKKSNIGSIEIICGSMFSGKTEELLRRLKRAKIAKQNIEIFKPIIDTRYSESEIVSHDKNAIQSNRVEHSSNILLLASNAQVVGIDEAQFFDLGLIEVCQQLADQGIRVIVAGLDMDFKRKPFGPIPFLCSIADDVKKVHAICIECGKIANFSYRLNDYDKQIMLGEFEEYKPLCRDCYITRQHPHTISS